MRKNSYSKRALTDTLISVHNKTNVRSVNFNKKLSKFGFDHGYETVYVFRQGQFIAFAISDSQRNDYGNCLKAKITYNFKNGDIPSACFTNSEVSRLIFDAFNLQEGSAYFSVRILEYEKSCDVIIEKVEDFHPASATSLNNNKSDMVNKKPEEIFTIQELWDAIKRLGFTGKISRTEELE